MKLYYTVHIYVLESEETNSNIQFQNSIPCCIPRLNAKRKFLHSQKYDTKFAEPYFVGSDAIERAKEVSKVKGQMRQTITLLKTTKIFDRFHCNRSFDK